MAALWVGGELPSYAAACLTSFTRNGHPTRLYTYKELRNVPSAVKVEDAGRIIDPAVLTRFAAVKKYSQFSNFFRYELLEKQDGICWIDTDLYCLRPIEAEPYIFGREDDRHINGAILALPSGSSILASLRRMFLQKSFVAPWLSRRERLRFRMLALLGRPVPREEYRWGTLGPHALTWYVREHSLEHHAKPKETFYPVSPSDTGKFFDPSVDWRRCLPAAARTVHLWNEFLRRKPHFDAPPPGSFLWKLLNGEPIPLGAPKDG